MTHETLEGMARDLAADVPLPADDWEAVFTLAVAMHVWVKTLDELPLPNVEPATAGPSPQ